jgi:hypothetical protein
MAQKNTPERILERRVHRAPSAVIITAFAGLAGIVFATLCPIGMRPHFASPNVERFGAYFVLGVLLSLAFPRRRLAVITGVLVLACALEAAQLLIPGRDGRVADAAVKALGGIIGASAGYGIYPLRRFLKSLHTLSSTTAPTVGPL